MRYPDKLVTWQVATEMIEDRTKFYGGSDIPAIMGEDPFKTPLMLWYEKKGLWKQKLTEAMIIGKTFEKPIIEVVSQALDWIIFDEVPGAKMDLGLSLPAVAHVDGIALVNGVPTIVEIKNLNQFNRHFEHYKWQVLWYMHLYGIDNAVVCILHGGNKLIMNKYEYDAAEFNRVMEALRQFDYCLVNDIRPDASGLDNEIDMLLELNEYKEVAKMDEIEDLVTRYLETSKRARELEKEATALKAEILMRMDERQVNLAVTDTYRLQVTKVKRISQPSESKTIEYKQLRVSKNKGE